VDRLGADPSPPPCKGRMLAVNTNSPRGTPVRSRTLHQGLEHLLPVLGRELVVRMPGIEPSSPTWKEGSKPITYTRIWRTVSVLPRLLLFTRK
jgi:hypothetical protein